MSVCPRVIRSDDATTSTLYSSIGNIDNGIMVIALKETCPLNSAAFSRFHLSPPPSSRLILSLSTSSSVLGISVAASVYTVGNWSDEAVVCQLTATRITGNKSPIHRERNGHHRQTFGIRSVRSNCVYERRIFRIAREILRHCQTCLRSKRSCLSRLRREKFQAQFHNLSSEI